ncbi:hypothetical protein SAMN02745691_00259 [Parasporobacterium paucivorans DSM 15970]|uniref:Uncharacterized protein n=2 Tax=Parasporobacterium TaxID=115543 RepID=A0A1M6B4U8_9FIRM|nr:hypothetical protein SAMN02745691_00259 [Parasporobacterium paucivorans DSM 15970]
MNKLKLIQGLLELVEEERIHKEWIDAEIKKRRARKLEGVNDIPWWEEEKFRNARMPNKALTADALRIIARLSFHMANGKTEDNNE